MSAPNAAMNPAQAMPFANTIAGCFPESRVSMITKPIKCTNCGKIAEQTSILPLCGDCASGLKDYEEQLMKSIIDVHINIDKSQPKIPADNFLKL
jgi:hypothetical protein